jgi:hypothetical protein
LSSAAITVTKISSKCFELRFSIQFMSSKGDGQYQ